MRRVMVTVAVCALGFPAVAGALPGPTNPPGTVGSLAVSDGNGDLVVKGTGVIYGYLDQGALVVFSYHPNDPARTLRVEGGAEQQLRGATTYAGSGVRFLLPAGSYNVELVGSGIDVSAVGSGTILRAAGAGTAADGSVTLDGGRQIAFDRVAALTSFGTPAGPGGGSTGSTTTTTVTTVP
jgi:hypothetical protein